MNIIEYKKPEEFLSALNNKMDTSSEEHDFMLGLVDMLIQDQGHYGTNPFLATVEEHNQVKLTAFLTPPWPILLSAEKTPNKTLCSALVEHLIKKQISLSGVNAKKNLSELFARQWCLKNNYKMNIKMEMKFFILKQVRPIEPIRGFLLKADETHRNLILSWAQQFNREVQLDENETYIESHVDYTLKKGNAFLWIDTKPVCMTFRERPYKNSISLGYVYTPPQLRHHGYATNCVAHVSQYSVNEGYTRCTLFTDAANPISNSIYQKIGYRHLCDYTYYTFIG
jgi:predicted GNAT family acetyltransferase